MPRAKRKDLTNPFQDRAEVQDALKPTLDDILAGLPRPETAVPAPTLGDLQDDVDIEQAVPSEPTMPGFVMSDEPIDPNKDFGPPADIRPNEPVDIQPSPRVKNELVKPTKKKGNTVKFTSRIQITEAYQFDGQVFKAPDWVNREWAAYDDGPTLYIPENGQTARKGDYVVKQDVTVDGGKVVSRVAVYDEHDFNRLFMPA